MIMLALQWTGSILIIVGYHYILKAPRASSALTFAGCVLTGIWAALLEPVGLGVITLEAFISTIALRNLWRLRQCTRC